MTVFAGIAEFERDLIRECIGRLKKMNEEQKLLARRLLEKIDQSIILQKYLTCIKQRFIG